MRTSVIIAISKMKRFTSISKVLLVLSSVAFSGSNTIAESTLERASRIIGGAPAQLNQFPYAVSIRFKQASAANYYHHCSGTILNENFIITAAHCVYNFTDKPNMFSVSGANVELSVNKYPQIRRSVSKIIIHEEYKSLITDDSNIVWPSKFDIAILKMRYPLTLNNVSVSSLPLPAEPNISIRGKATVVGWGLTSTSNPNISAGGIGNLHFVNYDIITLEECTRVTNIEIDNSQLCAFTKGLGSCAGDSGAPLICTNNNSHQNYLCGIVSGGHAECGNFPGIYTNVAYFVSWILSVIKDNSD